MITEHGLKYSVKSNKGKPYQVLYIFIYVSEIDGDLHYLEVI